MQYSLLNWKIHAFDELSNRQLYQILELRQRVFIVEQKCAYLDSDGLDQGAHHLTAANTKGELLAYSRILPKGIPYKEASIGRIITAPEVRATGLGIKLMKQSILELNKLYGNIPIRIMAQCYLTEFYRKFNFHPVGTSFMEDGIPHIEMLRTID